MNDAYISEPPHVITDSSDQVWSVLYKCGEGTCCSAYKVKEENGPKQVTLFVCLPQINCN